MDYNPCVNEKDKNNQNSTQVKHHIKHNVVSLSQKNWKYIINTNIVISYGDCKLKSAG